MKITKKHIILGLSFTLIFCQKVWAQTDISQYNGKRIQEIQIKTKRIDTSVIRDKFLLKEGDLFDVNKYEEALEKLHNMRIFKKLSFKVEHLPQGNVIIKIDGEDGTYVFPLVFFSGGGQKGIGLTFVEGNYFKKGEMIYIFAGLGDKGEMFNLGTNFGDYFVNLKFENMNFNRRFYLDNWVSTKGIFGSDKDKHHFHPLSENYHKQDRVSLMIARTKNNFTVFIKPEYFYLTSAGAPDSGIHSTVTMGLNYQENMRPGANFGALMGYGLSDKQEALRDLTTNKFGYSLSTSFKQGYKWAGNSYDIIKLLLSAEINLEFKNRNLLLYYLKAEDSFNSPFEDSVQTSDLLDWGKYLRQRYGKQGISTGFAYVLYLVRNNIGLLSFSPFYEFSSVFESGREYNQSGIGGHLSYKFWRFPFPVGINYTYSINDSSHHISFLVGGKF